MAPVRPILKAVPVTIQPFSALHAAAVRDYLVQQGGDSPAIVDWKYFDASFNHGRERGFACVEENNIYGTLGLIPFTVSINGNRLESAWSCDWYRNASLSGPLGILLMKQSLRTYSLIYSLGGSTQTRAIMPRLSQYTAESAGVELHKPLRLGGALRVFAKVAGIRLPESLPLIDKIPLRFFGANPSDPPVRISDDLQGTLEPVLSQPMQEEPRPAYDGAFIEWLLGRCPVISSRVCTVPTGPDSSLAIFFWCQVTDHRFWRVALAGDTGSKTALIHGLQAVCRYIMQEGGWMTSILASRLDTDLLLTLKRAGFVAAQRRPLYVLNQLPSVPTAELRRLSYLDTDYAYRFSHL
jgi:hypothetical protein